MENKQFFVERCGTNGAYKMMDTKFELPRFVATPIPYLILFFVVLLEYISTTYIFKVFRLEVCFQ